MAWTQQTAKQMLAWKNKKKKNILGAYIHAYTHTLHAHIKYSVKYPHLYIHVCAYIDNN